MEKIEFSVTNTRLLDMVWFLFGVSVSLFMCLMYTTHISTIFTVQHKPKTSLMDDKISSRITVVNGRVDKEHELEASKTGGSTNEEQLKSSENDKSIWKAVLKCQDIRLKRLDKRCKQLYPGLGKYLINYREEQLFDMAYMIVNPKLKTILKPIMGTNDSSWIFKLVEHSTGWNLRFEDTPDNLNIHSIPSLEKFGVHILRTHYSLFNVVKYLEEYFSILTVKHPLMRIEKIFSDPKLRNANTDLEFKQMQRKDKDKKKKRKPRRRRKNRSSRHLLSEDVEESNNNGNQNKLAPTVKEENEFELFLDDLLTGKKRHNGYLSPYDDAFPCIIPYKFIAKEETLFQDLSYVVHTKILSTHKYDPVETEKVMNSTQTFNKMTPLSLFTSLDHPDIYVKKVLEVYGVDMKLFGYTYHISNETGKIYATCETYDDTINMCC